MSLYNYENNISQIDRIDFDILGNAEILRMSAVRDDPIGIDKEELYDKTEPKQGSLLDPRMGIVGNNSICKTCGLNLQFCVGHFGHIKLAKPMFHVGLIRHVGKLLDCICPYCSKILINKTDPKLLEMTKTIYKKNLLAYVRENCKKIQNCPNCNSPIPKIIVEIKPTAETAITIKMEYMTTKEEGKKISSKTKQTTKHGITPTTQYIVEILSAMDCYIKLKNISDDDVYLLGMDPTRTRPENLIHRIFPVLPVPARPSAKLDMMALGSMEDDLTRRLMEIVRNNTRLYKETTNEKNTKYNLELMQVNIANYFSSDILGSGKNTQPKGGKIPKSLSSRLKGKEGRIRGSLMGRNW